MGADSDKINYLSAIYFLKNRSPIAGYVYAATVIIFPAQGMII